MDSRDRYRSSSMYQCTGIYNESRRATKERVCDCGLVWTKVRRVRCKCLGGNRSETASTPHSTDGVSRPRTAVAVSLNNHDPARRACHTPRSNRKNTPREMPDHWWKVRETACKRSCLGSVLNRNFVELMSHQNFHLQLQNCILIFVPV